MNGWNNTRLKNLLNEPLLYGLNVSSEYEDRDMPRYIRITDFDDFNNLNEQTFKSLPKEIAQSAQLKDGDLLFARSGASVGKTFLYHPLQNGACYAGYLIRARFDRQRVMPEYVSYYTKSQSYENWKNATYIQATIQNISAERYYQLPISIPPLEEQVRIVSYLNEKTCKIDARVSLLSKKRDAYQRLKKALISRVITKGLNPNAKLKPFGVDWIGEIPEGWEVRRIKEIGTLKLGKMLSEKPIPGYKLCKYLKSKNIGHLHLNLDSVEEMYFSEEEMNQLMLHKDDLLLSEGGEVGKTAIWNEELEECGIQNSVHKLTTFKGFSPNYYRYYSYMLSDNGYYKSIVNLVSIMHLTYEKLRRVVVLAPPLSEQQSIATYLDEKCSEIDANIANLEKQIEKYKELKRALISEVVTGKRRV